MKKTLIIIFSVVLLLCLSACNSDPHEKSAGISEEQFKKFTTSMTPSHDKSLYALVGVKTEADTEQAIVSIFSEQGESICEFTVGDFDRFVGMCWENNSHNIWVLYSDASVKCYIRNENIWVLDENKTELNI